MHRSKSSEIKDRLLKSITSGKFNISEPLPRIRKLAASFNVNKMTIQKVVNQLKEEGIIRSERARGLFLNSSYVAGKCKKVIILSTYTDESMRRHEDYPGNVFHAAASSLKESGYALEHLDIARTDEFALIENLKKTEIAGLILFEISNDHLSIELKKLMLPIVSIDYNACHIGISSAVYDNIWGAFHAVKKLHSAGHSRICFGRRIFFRDIASSSFADPVLRERQIGYSLAIKDLGIEEKILTFPSRFSDWHQAITAFTSTLPKPTAILFSDEGFAVDAAAAFSRLGFKIPDDFSFAAFGAGKSILTGGERCSAVVVDHAGIGRCGAELFLDRMKQGSGSDPSEIVLPVSFNLTDSVRIHH